MEKSPDRTVRVEIYMRVAIYLSVTAILTGIAWECPFLFELPLVAAIGGAYWAFFAGRNEAPPS